MPWIRSGVATDRSDGPTDATAVVKLPTGALPRATDGGVDAPDSTDAPA